VGGGISGITLALLLQQAGQRCIVLEARNIGFGTTGGTTAHLNTLLDTPYTTIIKDFGLEKARLIANITRAAIDLVEQNIQQFDINCGFEEVPAFLFAQNDEQVKDLENIFDACGQVGLEVSWTDDIQIPVPFKKAMRVERQARFHPLKYVSELAKAFEHAGGVIMEQTRVTDSHSGDRIRIETTSGEFSARALVYATHIPPGINLLHLRCPAYRSYAMAVKLEDNNYPEALAYDMYDPYHYYRTQEINGERFLIAGGDDHRTGDEPNTNGCFLKLESHVRSHFNVQEVTHQWSSQFFEAVDGIPYIGHLPGNAENIYVATGYGGNGITYSHVAALILKNIILKEQSAYTDLFAPGRVKPIAGFTEFIKHNADVVKQFVGRWFGKEELQELSALAPGEAKVVKYNDQSLALYKDDAGNLHAVSPACTHMKCAVNWNAAEKSWDCPCHGARYSYEGKVLTGPASKDLESVEIRSLVETEKS
jgi:glycine/D-amino acid oxidase-like deaminating enzyme/nitrite reductase/ring-hydroxylating ferredoxin subunit